MDHEALLADLSIYETRQLPYGIGSLTIALFAGVGGAVAAYFLRNPEAGLTLPSYAVIGLVFGVLMYLYLATIHPWIMESYRVTIARNVQRSLRRGLLEKALVSPRPRLGEFLQSPTYFEENPNLAWLIANYNLIARHFRYPIAIPFSIRLVQIAVFIACFVGVPGLISVLGASQLWLVAMIFVILTLGTSFDAATREGVLLKACVCT